MKIKIRAVTHDGLCVCWDNICFMQTSSKKITLYTRYGGTIKLDLKNYRYIKIVPNVEVTTND